MSSGMLRGCFAAFLLVGAAGPVAASPEVWVVNELSRDVSIIASDTEVVSGTVSLADRPEQPYGIAFSAVPGHVGQYAFVTQGSFIRVIDTTSRTVVRTVNISTFLGQPAVLKGCYAARPRDFVDTGGMPVLRTYLHVAAQVQPATGPTEIWFIVLDQEALAISPPGTPPIVGAGAMQVAGAGAILEAMDVTVLNTPFGPHFERAWYTFREVSPAPTIYAALVATPRLVGSAWSVVRTRAQPFTGGTPLPDAIALDVPYSRNLPLLPLGPLGRLLNLDTESFCDIGGVLRNGIVLGPGPGSFTVLAADRVADGVAGVLRLVDLQTCGVQTFPVGVDPVDVVTLSSIDWTKAFVANRTSDSVTVVRSDGTQATIALDMLPGPCTRCPRSIMRNFVVALACTVTDFRIAEAPNGLDLLLSWTPVGCEAGVSFRVSCVCKDSPDCPPGCISLAAAAGGADPPSTDGAEIGPMCEGEWKTLGRSLVPSYTHGGGTGGHGACYDIDPEE
jgi:hypothetical protein